MSNSKIISLDARIVRGEKNYHASNAGLEEFVKNVSEENPI